jgi:uncharacterized repeat protein (TIGR01451 family)
MKAVSHLLRRSLYFGVSACVLLPWGDASLRGGNLVEVGPLLPVPPECLPKDPPTPLLKIKVRVPACAAPGDDLTYHICIENCSPAEAHHVLVKNAVPANAKFVRAEPAPVAAEPELHWQLGTIGGGACREIVLVLQATNREDGKNCTRVQFEHGQCVVTRLAALPAGVPRLPSETGPPPLVPGVVPVPPEKMPGATKPGPAVKPGPGVKPPTGKPVPPITSTEESALSLTIEGHKQQYVNLQSRYFLTVSNASKTRATTVLLAATLPDKAKFGSASDKGQYLNNKVAWFLDGLDPGAKRTVELVLRASAPGQWCVKAEVLADKGIRADAEACTQFVGVSALTIDLTDREDPLIVGAKTSYVIPISNVGSAPVEDLKVRVLVPTGMKLSRTLPPEFVKQEPSPAGQWLEFAPLPKLDAGKLVTYEIFVEAAQVGEQRLRVEVTAKQLEKGPVIEEENTTVFNEEPAPPRQVLTP